MGRMVAEWAAAVAGTKGMKRGAGRVVQRLNSGEARKSTAAEVAEEFVGKMRPKAEMLE